VSYRTSKARQFLLAKNIVQETDRSEVPTKFLHHNGL
jgi:hypothetical protein